MTPGKASTVMAAWSVQWGRVGALVGGAMAWMGAARTSRTQWARELDARRLDRLDDAVAALQSAASPMGTKVLAATWTEQDLAGVSYACLGVIARAQRDAPRFANILTELADEMHERAHPAVITPALVTRMQLAGSVIAINGATITWLKRAHEFEAGNWTAVDFLARADPNAAPSSGERASLP